jgi:hypothetical protein
MPVIDLNLIRQIIMEESPSRLDVGTVISADPRGARTITVRLSGGRVCSRVKVCVEGLEVGDRVLVARMMQLDQVVVLGRVRGEESPELAKHGILAPPSNLVATAVPAAIAVRWDTYPGEDVSWWVQYNTSASATGAIDVLVTRGSYYIHHVVDASGDMATAATYHFRVRGMRWLGDNNVMYSGWSSWVSDTSGGHNLREIVELEFQDATELTIAAGVVTRTQVYHTIDTQGDAGTDDLDTISGGAQGDLLIIRPVHTDRTVVVKHGTGNIKLRSAADVTLDDASDILALLCYDGTNWADVGGSGAGGGGATTFLALTDTPGSYVDQAGRLPVVNDAESALQFIAAAGWLKVGAVSDIRWQPDRLAVLRAGVVTGYADPNDAFVAADTAGDVVLVPPDTWTLTSAHTLVDGVSIVGVGPAERCILKCTADVGATLIAVNAGSGVVENVRIEYTTSRDSLVYGLTAGTGVRLNRVVVRCENTLGAGVSPGAIAISAASATLLNCRALAYGAGNGISAGLKVNGGTLEYTYGYCYITNAAGTGTGITFSGTTPMFHCDGVCGGAVGTRYGAGVTAAIASLYHSYFSGDTADLRIEAGATAQVYACQYASVSNAGTLKMLEGDRTAPDVSATITAAWSFESLSGLEFTDAALLTISGGVVGRTQVYHKIDTEGAAGTDDLDTINGGAEGDLLVIRPADGTHTVVVKHNTGNIWLAGGASISLDDINDHLALVYDGTKWCDISGGAGGGGGVTDHGELDGLGDDDHPQYAALAQNETVAGSWTFADTIKGSGAPDVGTTTEAEKWGSIYLALTKDVYPDGETAASAGLMRRFVNKRGIDKYTHHRGEGFVIPAGCVQTTVPSTLWASWYPGYWGWFQGTYYAQYPNHASLPAGLTMHSADPIATDKELWARIHATGSVEFALWADNFDADRSYVVGNYIYRFDNYAYGNGPEVLLYTRAATAQCTAPGVGAAATFAPWVNHAVSGPYGPFCPAGDGLVLMIKMNYHDTTSRVFAYILGEQNSVTGYGNYNLYDDAWPGSSLYAARRCGTYHRLQGFSWACWDWYYLV